MTPTNLNVTDHDVLITREQQPFSLQVDPSNPFLATSSPRLLSSPQLVINSDDLSCAIFPNSPASSDLLSPHRRSSSSLKYAFGSTSHFNDSFASAFTPTPSASLSPVASTDFIHYMSSTPDYYTLGAHAASSPILRSSSNEQHSAFSLGATPFKSSQLVESSTLFDPQISPVVRKSLGDVTPIYDQVTSKPTFGDSSCETQEHSCDEESACSLPSSSPAQAKPSTTQFLQKIREVSSPLQKTSPVHARDTSLQVAPLASPFSMKSVPAPIHNACAPLTPSPARNIPAPAYSERDLSRLRRILSVDRSSDLSRESSPLSELSTTPGSSHHSPESEIVSEEENSKHRIVARSVAKPLSSRWSNAPTTRSHTRKRKYSESMDHVSTDPAARTMYSRLPPRKRQFTSSSSDDGRRMLLPVKLKLIKTSAGQTSSKFQNSTAYPSRIAMNGSGKSPTDARSQQRKFPPSVPINRSFPKFYQKFNIPSYFHPKDSPSSVLTDSRELPLLHKCQVNPPRSAYDLYTPRFTKGSGLGKTGLCPLCFEVVERRGSGSQVWLAMKYSAYKCYHMQYFHGVSPTTGLPFSPPIDFRIQPRMHARKHEKDELMEGRCHKCRKWVPVEGVKLGTVNVKELFWWKHAAVCHKGSMLHQDTDIFVEDDVFHRLKEYERDVEAAALAAPDDAADPN